MKLSFETIIQIVLVLAVFCVAKLSWSEPEPEEVLFILTPTDFIVSFLFSSSSHFEPGIGFVHNKLDIIINGFCAGHNFLLILFLCACFAIFQRIQNVRRRWLFILGAALLSYLITQLMNTFRIAASMAYPKSIADGFISEETLHELIGVMVYLISLITIYQCLQILLTKITSTRVDPKA